MSGRGSSLAKAQEAALWELVGRVPLLFQFSAGRFVALGPEVMVRYLARAVEVAGATAPAGAVPVVAELPREPATPLLPGRDCGHRQVVPVEGCEGWRCVEPYPDPGSLAQRLGTVLGGQVAGAVLGEVAGWLEVWLALWARQGRYGADSLPADVVRVVRVEADVAWERGRAADEPGNGRWTGWRGGWW